MWAPYSMLNLDEPLQALIVLACGHAFTAKTMDGHFELERGYTKATIPAALSGTTDLCISISTHS